MRGDASYTFDVDFGPESVFGVERYSEEQRHFFDCWLRDGPVRDNPPVAIFVMGGGSGRRLPGGKLDHGGCWRNEAEWPIARARRAILHMHNDGTLRRRLSPPGARPLEYDFDPELPVPSIGGQLLEIPELPSEERRQQEAAVTRLLSRMSCLRPVLAPGPAHQRESPDTFGGHPPYPLLCDRDDVLAFRTDALEDAVELTGSVVVHLWVASSAQDTDFTAKLVDEYPPGQDYPDGYHLGLCDSIIRSRYREGWDREVPLTPNVPVEVSIVLPPTSNVFAAGHRIRIDISSSNFPRLDINPNTGEPVGQHTHKLVAHQRIYCDATHPSRVELPVIPR